MGVVISSSYQLPNPYLEALLVQRSQDSRNWDQFATLVDGVLALFDAGVWQSAWADEVRRQFVELRARMGSTATHVMEAYDQAIRCQPETVGLDDPRAYWRARH